jgi:Uma2 family endonuclease
MRKEREMATTLVDREQEIFPDRIRWTRQECDKLREMGFLTGRYELIDGEIIRKTGQGWMHADVIGRLTTLLASLFGIDCLRPQFPMMVSGDTNEPEPDMAVTEQPRITYRGRHPNAQEMLLVVEVADTSLNLDLNIKARLYALAGVPDYWIVDIPGRCLHIYRDPTPDGYRSVTVHTESETVSLLLRPEVSVRVADLLPDPMTGGSEEN